MNTSQRRILITGGAGFIGSHVVRHFVRQYPQYAIYNLDALTYAGNLANLSDIESAANYSFIKGDIGDAALVESIFSQHGIDGVIHLAAESHVDRSISDPLAFVRTNVLGTAQLLNVARQHWKDRSDVLFYHVSTDEVYGALGPTGLFTEETPYQPHSPYSASKASSDHFVRAYHDTYGLPIVISNCSNNYGPYQFPEKLIPLMIFNIAQSKPLPVYGKGENVRDWLWVGDHVSAIDQIFHHGAIGHTYNIGGNNEWQNIELVRLICRLMDEALNRPAGTAEALITYVKDRPGHDLRYAIDASKIAQSLGWKPSMPFEDGLRQTIGWYLSNDEWTAHIRSGAYQRYYEQQYGLG